MPSKQPQPEFDQSEVITLLRMTNGNTVRELQELSHYKRDTPVSGDAINFFRSLAKTLKVSNNEGMDNNTSLRLSTETTPYMGIMVPITLTVHYADTDFDQEFHFDGEVYSDEDGNVLTLQTGDDGVITESTYFEVPESI